MNEQPIPECRGEPPDVACSGFCGRATRVRRARNAPSARRRPPRWGHRGHLPRCERGSCPRSCATRAAGRCAPMSSLDIAPHPEGAPTRVRDRRRMRHRLRVSFRRAGICTIWRLGFRQFSFRHIAWVPRRTGPDTWTRSPVLARLTLTSSARAARWARTPCRRRRRAGQKSRPAPPLGGPR